MRLTILGSGSSGNCAYIETPQARFLVDAGFSGKQIAERLTSIGRSLADIQAVLTTHEHADHVVGLPVLGNRMQTPIYANRLTSECLKPQIPKFNDWQLFKTGETFEIGDVMVETFPIPHDAYDPVGFVLNWQNYRIGFLTDLGYATKLVIERVKSCNVLILETNHDVDLLRADSKRPWSVKQRILARHGHLSNEAAAEVVEMLSMEHLEHLYLGHLSSDCNRPELARQVINKKLAEMQATHVNVHDTFQSRPCETLSLTESLTAAI